MLPFSNTEAMQMHLNEISRHVAPKAHGVVLMDRAGWHTTGKLNTPKNITIILLPSRAPELNPVENIWQYIRSNWLSNRVFDDYEAILDAGCEAWNKLLAQPETINRPHDLQVCGDHTPAPPSRELPLHPDFGGQPCYLAICRHSGVFTSPSMSPA